ALPDQLVAAVPARVVEGVDRTLHVTSHDDGGPGGWQLLGEVGPVARELLHTPDVQPRALEDRLALELVELGRDRVLVRDEPGPELRVLFGPASHSASPISGTPGAPSRPGGRSTRASSRAGCAARRTG